MQDPQHYERLSGDVGQLAAASADDTDDDRDDDVFRPEIVPIAEGEVTLGKSGVPTEWSEDVLREATEQGVFDNAKLLKGRPGPNPHKPIDEQAPPDEIVGDAGTFRYEDGRGPVSNGDGVVTDDHIADLIEHGLVDISPDTFRKTGEFDEQLADGEGAYPVEEILDVPWMTILDKAAGENAELEPAEAEALAALPRAEDFGDASAEQLASLQFLRFWPSPLEASNASDLEAAADALDAIGGVDAILRAPLDADGEPQNPELLAVLDPEAADLGSLNEAIRDALAETPFAVDEGYNWVPELEHEHLAARTAHRQSTIGAESLADPADDTTMTDDNTTKEELHEQLAAARSELDEQEDQIETLQDETEELEATNEELEAEKETLEAENEDLKENNETFRRALAAKYAEQSPMDAESAMDRLSVDDMVEDLDDGPDGDDDDRSPKERLSEQLAAGIEMRGSGTDNPDGGEPSDADLEQAEQLAGRVLTVDDVKRINNEGVSNREYVKREHDVDPADYGSVSSLKQAVGEGGD